MGGILGWYGLNRPSDLSGLYLTGWPNKCSASTAFFKFQVSQTIRNFDTVSRSGGVLGVSLGIGGQK